MSEPTTKTLLVVDEDATVLSLLSDLAHRNGFAVMTANSGDSFRHALLQCEPTLIFLELQLPYMDGVECLRYLASHGCKAEVVLLSNLEPKVLSSARRFGLSLGLKVTEGLHKPVRITEFDAVVARHADNAMNLTRVDLVKAIDEHELVVHYQPIVGVVDHGWSVTSVEALVRWQHPQYGLLMPDQFLGLAERENLMIQLTDFVLDESLRQVGHWHGRGWTLGLTVNLPASCISDLHFPDRLMQSLAEYGVAPQKLCFDVTETALVGDQSVIMDSFARLRVRGVELALDDFGVGASSLTQLYKLPYCSLKIDHNLVGEVPESQQARTIVNALVELGHQLSLKVCAEGVRNEATFDMLERAGCDNMQGDFISPALPAAALERFVRDWHNTAGQASALLAG